MSLSCLTCKILRTDSSNELNGKKFNSKDKHKFSGPNCLGRSVERSWSGNLTPSAARPDDNMTHSLLTIPENRVVKKGSQRLHNSGPLDFPTGTPKLVRSPGIRRDWSFEDLQGQ
ncbi:hypothetical protein HAX54_019217, partial [Datura stramonium]|nr:hypothetical protein [Datura stramonium]